MTLRRYSRVTVHSHTNQWEGEVINDVETIPTGVGDFGSMFKALASAYTNDLSPYMYEVAFGNHSDGMYFNQKSEKGKYYSEDREFWFTE